MKKLLRGERASAILRSLGIEPTKFWLLLDLFTMLAERGEFITDLGRDYGTMKAIMWLYFVMSGVFSLMLVGLHMPWQQQMWMLLGMSLFMMLLVLLTEAANSIVNPVEGLILAHQPVN